MRVIVSSQPTRPGQKCSIEIYFEDDEYRLPVGHVMRGHKGGSCREMADFAKLWAIDQLRADLENSLAFRTTQDQVFISKDCSGLAD